jgi:hypothetical protein
MASYFMLHLILPFWLYVGYTYLVDLAYALQHHNLVSTITYEQLKLTFRYHGLILRYNSRLQHSIASYYFLCCGSVITRTTRIHSQVSFPPVYPRLYRRYTLIPLRLPLNVLFTGLSLRFLSRTTLQGFYHSSYLPINL